MSVSKYVKKKPLMCLCLKTAGGQSLGSSTMIWEDGALLGEYMTHNIGESPNVAVESRLSAILEECPHQKYYLSSKACQGILTRATRRGKELPKPLLEALKNQIESGMQEGTYGETESSAESHPIVIDRAAFRQGKNAKFDIKIEETETAPTLVACGPHAVAQPVQYRVRRLTPLECTRLQGYPDGWVDIGDWIDSKGKKHKEADAPKYKALGNSIAIPFWRWLMHRIYGEVKKLEPAPVLGSLFDGIGGFPLCWPGETAWSSEIDEFPLAVLGTHFGC